MAGPRSDRRLAAILAADVVGYSRLMAVDEQGTHACLTALRTNFIEPTIAAYHGRMVKLMGDGALVEFPSAVDAVECAAAIQEGVAERQKAVSEEKRIAFRIGINIGDIIIEQEDIYGDGVNISARLEALAEPGGICIARNVYNQVKNKVAFGFEPMGEHKVKNIPEPITIYRLRSETGLVAKTIGFKNAAWRAWPWVAGAVLLTAFVLAAALRPWDDNALRPAADRPEPATFDLQRVAVLPFTNMSPDPDNAYFADGITEELTTRIAQVADLAVIARTSVMRYKDTDKSIGEIGRELRVGTILEGSVRKAGDQVRITAQLIDVASESHLWAEHYDRTLADLFSIQSAVAQEVVESLHVTLMEDERVRLAAEPTDSVQAHTLYLRAMHLWDQSSDIVRAVDLLRQAIEEDPGYAVAHAALADLSLSLASYTNTPADVAQQQAADHATTALALNDELAEAHFAMARVKMSVEWDWDTAEAHFKRAIELNPNLTRAKIYYGWRLLMALRRQFDAALEEIQEALARDPLSIDAMSAMAWVRYRHEYEAAIATSHDALELFPDEPWFYANVGQSLVRQGHYDEGIEALTKAIELAPESGWIQGTLGWAYGMAGREQAAWEIVKQLRDQARKGYLSPIALALTLTGLGEKEQALDRLEQAYVERDNLIIWLRGSDFHDVLAGEPRYEALVEKMGLPT